MKRETDGERQSRSELGDNAEREGMNKTRGLQKVNETTDPSDSV